MTRAKTFLLLILLQFTCAPFVYTQQYIYPNELKEFGLFKSGNWKSLTPFVSTKKDVEKIFRGSCSKEGCDYNENWRFKVVYIDQCWSYSESSKTYLPRIDPNLLGKLANIAFYPKKRIKTGNLKFGEQFKISKMEITHSVPSLTASCADSYGLIYETADENTDDKKFQKGDLVRVVYSWSDSDFNKYRNKLTCYE